MKFLSYVILLNFVSLLFFQFSLFAPIPLAGGGKKPSSKAAKPKKKKEAASAKKILESIKAKKYPAFSADEKNQLIPYKKFITALSAEDDEKIFDTGLTNFLKVIVNNAITRGTPTLQNLVDTKTATESLITKLTILDGQLKAADKRKAKITAYLSKLKQQLPEIEKRIDKQRVLTSEIDRAQKLDDKQFQNKVALYAAILPLLDATVVDETKVRFISDLSSIAPYAKKQGGKDFEAINKLVADAQIHPFFTMQQRQLVAGVFQEKPMAVAAGMALPPPVPGVKSNVVFQNRYKEVVAKKTILEKIVGARELLSLIDAGAVQPDKNSLTMLVNDLFAQHGLMKKDELTELANFLGLCSASQFLLALNQRPTIRQWTELVGRAGELIVVGKTLLDSLKDQIGKEKTNFVGALKAATYAVNLLSTRLPSTELNKNNKTGLLALLRQKIPSYYNSRANKTVAEIGSLNDFFTVAQARTDIKDVLKQKWVGTLALDMSLMTARAQPNMSARIASWQEVAQTIKASTDHYEKGIFFDDLAAFFAKRAERAGRELEEFKKLLALLQSENFKKNKVFERNDFARFRTWENVLDGTRAMREAQEDRPVQQKIKRLSDALPLLTQAGVEAEKNILVQIISDLFLQRGLMARADLDALKQLFEKIKKTAGLLASNQLSVLNAWIAETDQARLVATGSMIYFDAMVADATAAKDIAKFIKVTDLFTIKTPDASKSAFVNGLNTLFAARKTLDPNTLLNLFNRVDTKRVAQAPLLSSAQQIVLKQWIQIINTEAR